MSLDPTDEEYAWLAKLPIKEVIYADLGHQVSIPCRSPLIPEGEEIIRNQSANGTGAADADHASRVLVKWYKGTSSIDTHTVCLSSAIDYCNVNHWTHSHT